MSKHVVVIGGGPGGYSAAIRLSQLGAKVTLIEKEAFGGTCLHRGCIPTKAMLKSAEVCHTLSVAESFGLKLDGFVVDFVRIMERKNEIVKKLGDGIVALLKANKINTHIGCGYLVDKHTVLFKTIDNTSTQTFTADAILLATGATPSIPPIPGAELPGILTSDSLLQLQALPKSLSIIGGGIIGMEFASIFQTLGCKVTVLEALPGILAKLDTDIVKRVLPLFKKRGMEIHTGTVLQSITQQADGYRVMSEGKQGPLSLDSEQVLLAIGRKPYTAGLGLENIGLVPENGRIVVDVFGQTAVDGVYAIGDVTGEWMLAHWAAHQGITAAQHIMEGVAPVSKTVPSCVYSFPEIASAGLTEEAAKIQYPDYKTARFLFGANGKALCDGASEGFVKVIASSQGQLLGVHILGAHASDLIHEGVLAIDKGLTVSELSQVIHAHPTLSEAFAEAVQGLDGLAIHMLK